MLEEEHSYIHTYSPCFVRACVRAWHRQSWLVCLSHSGWDQRSIWPRAQVRTKTSRDPRPDHTVLLGSFWFLLLLFGSFWFFLVLFYISSKAAAAFWDFHSAPHQCHIDLSESLLHEESTLRRFIANSENRTPFLSFSLTHRSDNVGLIYPPFLSFHFFCVFKKTCVLWV